MSLSAIEIHTYPYLEVLAQELKTGPVTTATNESVSFSAPRYLKTYLQFTTKEGVVVVVVYPTPSEG